MISRFDDDPIHQTEPIAQRASSGPNVRDRYGFDGARA
jgi:hypothetical protein